MTKAEQQLWCEVLFLAFQDAVYGLSKTDQHHCGVGSLEDARDYILRPHGDFVTVCHLAGVDPEVVRERFHLQLAGVSASPSHAPSNRLYTYNGRTLTLTQWASECDLPLSTLRHRIKTGWCLERALATPIGSRPEGEAQAKPRGRPGKRYEHDGRCLTLREWSKITGLPCTTLRRRLAREGHTLAQALANVTPREVQERTGQNAFALAGKYNKETPP